MIFRGMKFASHTRGAWPGIIFKTEDERREEALQFSSSAKAGNSKRKKLSEQRLSIFPHPTNDLSGGNCFRQAGRLTGPSLHSFYVVVLHRGIPHGLG
jgi:hypothetical protein